MRKDKELQVVKAFIKRARAEGLTKDTEEYLKAHNMFFLGALSVLGHGDFGIPAWSISIMSGRDIVDLYREDLIGYV